MKKHLRTIGAAALFAVTLCSPNAFAADAKNYPGSSCQPLSHSNSGIIFHSGGAFNSSSVPVLIECPIIKDDIAGRINKGVVGVIDVNANAEVSCFITSRTLDATLLIKRISGVTVRSDAEPGGEAKRLFFGVVKNPSSSGYYSMTCNLPPTDAQSGRQSGIVYYQVEEGPVPTTP
jgi:hypothetical protein